MSTLLLLYAPTVGMLLAAGDNRRSVACSLSSVRICDLEDRYAAGRKTALTIHLTADDRQTLLAWQRSTTIWAGRARWARTSLLLPDGGPVAHVATMVGITRRYVYKWAKRFLQDGVEGLADK